MSRNSGMGGGGGGGGGGVSGFTQSVKMVQPCLSLAMSLDVKSTRLEAG